MSSFQAPIGLPPLSVIASVAHDPTALPTSDVAGAPASGALATVDYHDARIKDPVPKKLKGHTDNTNGNFSIMQMDLGGRESSLERDQLAKRSSANTELAAMRAYNNSYPISSTKRFVRVPDEATAWPSYHNTPATSQAPPKAPALAHAELPRSAHPLTPSETKEEQARLLKLLRGLQPSSVVDQVCAALAYFGGTQGAGPPIDGVFPRSELANGSGNMFVGWIAEIFPKLPNETTEAMRVMPHNNLSTGNPAPMGPVSPGGAADSETGPPAALSAEETRTAAQSPQNTNTTAPVGKRPRGRPKGSKATKVRKDKGLKKDRANTPRDPIKPQYLIANALHTDTQAHSAVTGGGGRLDEDNWVDVEDSLLNVAGADEGGLFFPTNAAVHHTPGTTPRSLPDGSTETPRDLNRGSVTELGKKRGRPKGSKNKPKAPDTTKTLGGTTSGTDPNVNATPSPSVPGQANSVRTSGRGRPRGSSRKMKQDTSSQTETSGGTHEPDDEQSSSQPQEAFDTLSPVASSSHQLGIFSDTASAAAGGKRKRASKALMQTDTSLDSPQRYPTVNDSQAMTASSPIHPLEPLITASTPMSKKVKKTADARASTNTNGTNGISSQAVENSTLSSVMGLSAISTSLGGNPRDVSSKVPSGTDGEFNTNDFEALSSHLDQEPPTTMAVQHPVDRDQSILSQHPQQRQHLQQHHLSARNNMSETSPLPSSGHIQGLISPVIAHQSQTSLQQQQPQQQLLQQQQQQELNQTRPQHLHSLPQTSNLGVSSAPAQHGVQPQIPGSIASSSLAAAQQLPQPTRSVQSYYAQNRPSSSSPFSQSLPLPQLQNNHQQLQQSKPQSVSQYAVQSPYTPQPQLQGFVSHAGQRSPQFGAANPSRLRTTPDTYGAGPTPGPMAYGSPAFNQPRRTNATQESPSLGGMYGTSGPSASHGLSHHGSPSFAPSRLDTRSAASHAQGVVSSAQGMQSFHSFDNQALFDGINLDTAGSSGSLSLGSTATYNLSGNAQRTPSNNSGYGTIPSVPSFDASIGGNSIRDRFYTVHR